MGLLAPAALGFAALMVPVIAMYFIRQRRDAVLLPSIALWARFVKDRAQASRFQRFLNDPLLWLQLLVLAALIVALARPFQRGVRAPGQATVIVLDASASMQVLEDGKTRFDSAKADIAAAVRALGGGDRMMLVAAGPRPWVVQGLTDDARAFRRALDALQCTDGRADLPAALRVAAQAAGPGAPPFVRVWSDGAGDALDGVADVRLPVEWNAVGDERNNVAITALAVRRKPESPLDFEVFVSVANLGTETRDVGISLSLEDTLLFYGKRTLPPEGTVILTEPLLAGRSGVVRVRLDIDDALEVDNTASLVLTPQRATRILLVTRGNALLQRVLQLLPGTAVTSVSPQQVQLDVVRADLVVFDRWVPGRWPQAPALVIGPRAWPAGTAVKTPRITSWRRKHPLLRYLTFAEVHVNQAIVQGPARGVTPLVSTDTGSLIWSQLAGGSRQIVIGFALTDSDWILHPSFPLFLSNVLDDVRATGGAHTGVATRVGEMLRVRPTVSLAQATVVYPDGRTETLPAHNGILTVGDTWQAGLYRLMADGWSDMRAVNLVDAAESRVAPRPLPGDMSPEALRAGVGVTREFWPWLLALALLLGVGEWAVYHRRTY